MPERFSALCIAALLTTAGCAADTSTAEDAVTPTVRDEAGSAIPTELVERALRQLTDVAGAGVIPAWADAILGRARAVERPGQAGVAYYEIEVLVGGAPAGYEVLSTGAHDAPIVAFAATPGRPTDRLASAVAGRPVRRYLRADGDTWAELEDGTLVDAAGETLRGVAALEAAAARVPDELRASFRDRAARAWQQARLATEPSAAPQATTERYCGTPGAVPHYWQMKPHELPNDSWYKSGCGATAWAMLLGWASQQAFDDPGSKWAPFKMLFREGGVESRTAPVVRAPAVQDGAVAQLTWELKSRLHTTPGTIDDDGNSGGATLPSEMDDAADYLQAVGIAGSEVSVDTDQIGGAHTDEIRDRAIHFLCDDVRPAILGIGDLKHYPVAEAYYQNASGAWFYVNEGRSGGGFEDWVDADIFFAGTIHPLKAPPGLHVASATYGGNCGGASGNVTAALVQRCEGRQRCAFQPGAIPLADVSPSCAEGLTLSYRCGADPTLRTTTWRAGQTWVDLACADGWGTAVTPSEYVDGAPDTAPMQRQLMHACPQGDFMTGAHLGRNAFLCSSSFRPRAGVEIVDYGTQWNGIHVCPSGKAMTGLQQSRNQLLCADIGALTDQSVDTGTQRAGMHACPNGKVMVGIHAGKNWLVCARPK